MLTLPPLVLSAFALLTWLPQQPLELGGAARDSILVTEPDRPVVINAPDLATIEPHLVANPRDPQHLLAGVFLVKELGDPRNPDFAADMVCSVLTSFDAGATWLRHDFQDPSCADPWVAILPGGGALFVGLARTGLVVYRSADGGRTWNDTPVNLGPRHDHGSIATDATGGSRHGDAYVAAHLGMQDSAGLRRSAVMVARTIDGGATFGEPARIVSSNLPAFANNPVVLSDGTLIVPFVTYARGTVNEGRLDQAWTIASSDGAVTFFVPRFLADCVGHWGQLAVDATPGPFRDRLYWVCWDEHNRNIRLYYSSDRGEIWSPPVVLNRGTEPVQTAVVAVNREGVVGVSWYDGREDPRAYRGGFACQHIYFTASLDGGQTFLPDVKVSAEENCPDTPANGEAGRRWKAGGDYHGLAAAADGQFHLLWADSREGIYQLRTATVRVDGNVAARP
jgi:hypothetical protein